MLHAVLLLVATGEFVLLDAVLHIVVDIGGYHKSVLGAAVHRLGIYVVVLLVVLNEPSVTLERLKVGQRLTVHFGVMLVGSGSKSISGLMM